eukprot:c18905_g1_i1.p1 GENE.c18905_g1_i1~~c18905_g1_i1.p1  ORF type:complete len:695 (+),score=82.59 c18905_g1_i1:37-2085(+)
MLPEQHCGWCAEELSEEASRCPRVLECGHFFCTRCVLGCAVCPECEDRTQECPIGNGQETSDDTKALPPRSISFLKTSQQEPCSPADKDLAETCHLCDDAHPATFWCQDCKEAMCTMTAEIHQKSRMARHHVVVGIEEASATKLEVPQLVCKVHEGKPFCAYDLQCQQLICGLCATIGSHRGHECKEIAQVVAEFQSEVDKWVVEGQALVQMLQAQADAVAESAAKVEAIKAAAHSQIQALFDKLRQELASKEGVLLRQVDQAAKQRHFELHDRKQCLGNLIACGSHGVSFGQAAAAATVPEKLVEIKQELQELVEHLRRAANQSSVLGWPACEGQGTSAEWNVCVKIVEPNVGQFLLDACIVTVASRSICPETRTGQTGIQSQEQEDNLDATRRDDTSAPVLVVEGSTVEPLLFDVGDVNKCDESGCSPIFIAAREGRADYIQALVAAGGNVNKSDKHGTSPISVAAQKGNADCVLALVSVGADVHECHYHSKTSLIHTAAEFGHADCVRALLSAGIDANKCDYMYMSPIHFAARSGNADCIRAILAAGGNAHVNRRDLHHMWPLFYATENGSLECIEALVSAGADVNQFDDYQDKWPMCIAVLSGNADAIKILAKAGADVNKCSKYGDSIWRYASRKFNADCIRAIIAAGADMQTFVNACANDSHMRLVLKEAIVNANKS